MALIGSELLDLVKSMDGASKSDLVRAAGYVSTKKDGTERLNFTAFYEAVVAAKGVVLGGGRSAVSAGGRLLCYETKVQFNGNLLVGKAYTRQLDLKPGDTFKIRLGKTGQITLIPLAQGEAEEGAEPGCELPSAEAPAPEDASRVQTELLAA